MLSWLCQQPAKVLIGSGPRGPHGDSAFVQTRASPPALALNMAAHGAVTWPCHPLTDIAPPPAQRRPSVRTRPSQGIYDAATNPSPSLFPFLSFIPLRLPFALSRSPVVLVFPLHPVLFLHSPLQRRLKYLHGQIERYCAESLDYLWSNTGKNRSAG